MLVTEKEAKSIICPIMSNAVMLDTGGWTGAIYCQGAGCMFWVWSDLESEYKNSDGRPDVDGWQPRPGPQGEPLQIPTAPRAISARIWQRPKPNRKGFCGNAPETLQVYTEVTGNL